MIPFPTPPGGRALFWAVAAASFLAACGALGARGASLAGDLAAMEAASAMTARVLNAEGQETLEQAAQVLRAAPGVISATPMSASRAAELVGAWTDGNLRPADMPALQLVEIQVEPAAASPELALSLTRRLAEAGVTAQIFAPERASEQAKRTARMQSQFAQYAALGIAAAMGFCVWLIGRARAAAGRDAIATLTDLGAKRSEVTASAGGEAFGSAFAAGVIGALAAAVTMYAASRLLGLPDLADIAIGAANPEDFAPLAATPVLAGVLAWLGARAAAAGEWRRAALRP
jgi:cell division transport system permease protein